MSEEAFENMLPVPAGYHILIAIPNTEETFGDTGILKANTTKNHDTILSTVGLVLDLGPQAYLDPEKFPTGPWCKPGDYIMFRGNSGTRFKIDGQEYRLLNDDSVQAVVKDPAGVQRV